MLGGAFPKGGRKAKELGKSHKRKSKVPYSYYSYKVRVVAVNLIALSSSEHDRVIPIELDLENEQERGTRLNETQKRDTRSERPRIHVKRKTNK